MSPTWFEIMAILSKTFAFWVIETICIAFFTVEFVLRLWAAADRLLFIRGFMNLIDLAAILPYYVTLIFQKTLGSGFNLQQLFEILLKFRNFSDDKPWFGSLSKIFGQNSWDIRSHVNNNLKYLAGILLSSSFLYQLKMWKFSEWKFLIIFYQKIWTYYRKTSKKYSRRKAQAQVKHVSRITLTLTCRLHTVCTLQK